MTLIISISFILLFIAALVSSFFLLEDERPKTARPKVESTTRPFVDRIGLYSDNKAQSIAREELTNIIKSMPPINVSKFKGVNDAVNQCAKREGEQAQEKARLIGMEITGGYANELNETARLNHEKYNYPVITFRGKPLNDGHIAAMLEAAEKKQWEAPL